ncbi:MAG: acetyltransferase [Hyphomicrobium sp.]|uniref:acetyltransferase n=1 Tax=Hyphomicrobium sp. TaxID=82 RepID=UPI0039E3F461
MNDIILFAVGSALTVEFEESCDAAGATIEAWVSNWEGVNFSTRPDRVVQKSELSDAQKASAQFLCPLFRPANRKLAVEEALAAGLLPSAALIDPRGGVVSRSTTFGQGSYVNAGVIIGAAGTIGDWVVINRSASIGHHARIENFVSIGPGAITAGEVRIGEGAMLGAGCIVVPQVRIGAKAIVGAGSVVTKDVPDGVLVFGNPAKIVRRLNDN